MEKINKKEILQAIKDNLPKANQVRNMAELAAIMAPPEYIQEMLETEYREERSLREYILDMHKAGEMAAELHPGDESVEEFKECIKVLMEVTGLKAETEGNIHLLKSMRLSLDGIEKLLDKRGWKLNTASLMHATQNTYDAITAARRARYWMGKELGLIGLTNPYQPVKNEKDIPATADTLEDEQWLDDYGKMSRLDFVNALRKDVGAMVDDVRGVDGWKEIYHKHYILQELGYVSMHLGYILGAIRENAKQGS